MRTTTQRITLRCAAGTNLQAAGFIHGAELQKTGYSSTVLYHVSDWYHTLLAAVRVPAKPFLKDGEVPWKEGDGIDN